MNTQESINLISIWSIIFPFLAGGLLFKCLNKDSKIFYYLVVADFCSQMSRFYLGKSPALNFIYNIDIIAQLLLLSVFFQNKFSSKNRLYFKVLIFFCFLIVLYFLTFENLFEKFYTWWVCFNFFIYITLILLLILEYYEDDNRYIGGSQSVYLYIFGIFMYMSCTMVIFSLWDYISSNKSSYLNNLWIIHDLFNILMYILFGFGFIIDFMTERKNE